MGNYYPWIDLVEGISKYIYEEFVDEGNSLMKEGKDIELFDIFETVNSYFPNAANVKFLYNKFINQRKIDPVSFLLGIYSKKRIVASVYKSEKVNKFQGFINKVVTKYNITDIESKINNDYILNKPEWSKKYLDNLNSGKERISLFIMLYKNQKINELKDKNIFKLFTDTKSFATITTLAFYINPNNNFPICNNWSYIKDNKEKKHKYNTLKILYYLVQNNFKENIDKIDSYNDYIDFINKLKDINDKQIFQELYSYIVDNFNKIVNNYISEIKDSDEEKQKDDLQDIDQRAIEGNRKLKQHLVIERDPSIIKKKKDKVKEKNGELRCEVCGFLFLDKYGKIGEDFIEGHHLIPLKEIDGQTETNVKDIALICSNCHRMIHKGKPVFTIEELKSKIKQKE
ncbi:HNH endonuclease [Candidatus Dependentiae bacterium]|nr:HNH endonuclease [Candidatus Dependentiae bacterium]